MSGTVSRYLAAGLAVSVAVNLFLAGMITAGWLMGRDPEVAAREAPPPFFRRGMAALSEEVRPIVEDVRRRHAREIVQNTREVRAARREVREALSAGELDRARLEAAFQTLRQRTDRAQSAIHGLMVEIAAALPPDQRREFFERVRPHHMVGRRGPRDRPPPPPPD
jgi:uncharacterized membrane protein